MASESYLHDSDDRLISVACAILDRALFQNDSEADEDEAALEVAARVLSALGLS